MRGESFSRSAARLAALGLPVFIVYWLLANWLRSFLDNRLLMASVAMPLSVACWVLWRWLERDRDVLLGRRYTTFLAAYCCLFALLAQASARTAVSTGAELASTDPLADLPPEPGRPAQRFSAILGDLHYRLAPPAPPAPDLLIVTLPPFAGRSRGAVRRELGLLIHNAVERGALGIGLDYYLETSTPADDLFCFQVRRADEAGIPVFVGYRHQEIEGIPVARPPAESIARCLRPDQQGWLSGVVDLDGRLRSVPLTSGGEPSLSLRVAEALAGGDITPPADGLVRFLEPQRELVRFNRLPRGEELELFRDRFVLVGSASEHDRHLTPLGELQGVEIHAYAAHGLRSGHLPRLLSPAWGLPTLFALCYLLTGILARGGGWRKFLAMTSVATVAVVAAAILANRFGLIWIELFTPLAGLWGLAATLLVGSGAMRRLFPKPRQRQGAQRASTDEEDLFDVFLSHNSEDKPIVRDLADALETRGLHPWLDERELIPGGDWQRALEDAIEKTRTAAVLIGPAGLGPWQDQEMRACLLRFVDNGKRLIPVLLPKYTDKVKLPAFLTLRTIVDLRDGLTGAGLDRLVWGITGEKPAGRRRSQP